MNYWKAADHQFGKGKIHVLDEGLKKTICGQEIDLVDGRRVNADGHNCKACEKSLRCRQKQEEAKAQSEIVRKEFERKNEEFWIWYNQYLLTPEWKRKRALVMKRCQGVCEGCLSARAEQVHHLHYRRVGREMLFDLVAVCKQCHDLCHDERNA